MAKFTALPKGVSEQSFASAIQEWRVLLGQDQVRTEPGALEPYLSGPITQGEEARVPSAVVFPASEKQVQSVVAVANKYKTPLWPCYGGENEGYGRSTPATRGQVIVDLRRMRKIVEVDRELGYCLVEPGVTYGELQQHLKSSGANLWLDAPAASAGVSVVGSILERGSGYTPYSEEFLFSCGMEVVLGSGSLLRTGMGGIQRSTSWQVFKWGFGPYVDGLFSQGNNGIVTKLGTWLMGAPPPGGYKPFCVRLPRASMIGDAIRPLMFLRQSQIVPNAVAIANAGWDAAMSLAGGGGRGGGFVNEVGRVIPTGTLMERYGVGAWNLYGAVYGSPEQVALNWKYVEGTFRQAFGGEVRIVTEDQAQGDPAFQLRKQLMMGETTAANPLDRWRPGGASMRFSATASARPGECADQVKLASEIVNRHGFDYLAELSFFWRDARHVVDVRYDPGKADEAKRAHGCLEELGEAFARHGWGVNRAHVAFMDQVAESYGPAMRRLNRTIKRALDPNNIVAPGKSGIDLS
ncbi:MAG: FAD-binding oxidoreductase [Anaeromyxobacteraceae bacterium]